MKPCFTKKWIILWLVAVLFICMIVFRPVTKKVLENKSVEIVVSRYNETLKWIKNEPFTKYNITVYNKGDNDEFEKPDNVKRIVPLKNVGRESHTFLRHIINNYNNLSDITVFLPGSTEMPNKMPKTVRLIESIEEHGQAVFLNADGKFKNIKEQIYDFTLDEWQSTNKTNKMKNAEINTTLAPIRPFGKWFEANFGDIVVSNITYLGIFSVAKDDILNHPLEYYENLESQLSTSSNPEVGHYFERAWGAVFHPMTNTMAL